MKKDALFKICLIVNGLTVADFASRLNISTQYVYMVLKNPSISPRVAAQIEAFIRDGRQKAIDQLESVPQVAA